jgi:methionyl-tRNA formyltransferase
MGTPEFAVASLKSLLENKFNVVGVVTVPDKPAGRGQQLHQSAVKKFALENNLKLLQPEKLKDPQFISELKALNADLQIVVAFRMLPEVVWNMPALGTYNLHASLLPKYRGAAPINWAIINGEKETGVTTFKLKHEIDTGNILFNEKVKISDTMNAGELHDSLMNVGSELIIKTVKEIEKSTEEGKPLAFQEQKDENACHAPKIFKETCKIDWQKPVQEIYNLVRGLSPYPTAFTELYTEERAALTLKIFNCKFELAPHNETNGSLLTDNKSFFKVYAKGGIIEVTGLQLQGKKRMSAVEFLRGFRIPSGMRLG